MGMQEKKEDDAGSEVLCQDGEDNVKSEALYQAILVGGVVKTDSLSSENKSNINIIREWVQDQPHIPHDLTDFQILSFLSSNDNNIDETKRILALNYKLKEKLHYAFSQRDPFLPEIEDAWKVMDIAQLPEKTQDGQSIIYIGLRDPDPSKFNLTNIERLFHMATEACLITYGLNSRYIALYNVAGASLKHLRMSYLHQIRRELNYVQEAIPLTITQVHILGCSPTFKRVFNTIRVFLSPEIRNKIVFHSDLSEEFYKYIPKDLMPRELGGKVGPLGQYTSDLKANMENLKSWFAFEENQREQIQKSRAG